MPQLSVLFADVMSALWSDDLDAKPPKLIIAIASYAKNHKINPDNALEVLDVLFRENVRSLTARLDRKLDRDLDPDGIDDVWFDVSFDDDSQALIIAKRGIGSAVEVLS